MTHPPEKIVPNIIVGIATTGRSTVLAQTLARLDRQTRRPDRIIISAIRPEDYEGLPECSAPVTCLTTGRGASQQRNHILDRCNSHDIVVFFDDDFLPCDDYLAELHNLLANRPEIVLVTGKVLADGVLTGGIPFEAAEDIVTAAGPATSRALTPVYNGYGCNMAVRMSALHAETLRFDENLPLYSWLEDVDFSRRLAPYGKIYRADGARGVHMGVASGRTPGLRLGYSQIVNPFYLARKGTVAWAFGLRLAGRNILANLVKTPRPEPHIDRFGRLRGNLRGLWHIATGRADPMRICDF
ncbi:MAG: glycosyltransferase [Silicimonas sp.]|nr:glycosyltransferase [Silicimonas sp.]